MISTETQRPPTGALWVILLAAIAVTAGLLPARAASRPLVTGISDPESTGAGEPVVFDRIQEAGARLVRLTVLWPAVAPSAEPADWNPADPADTNYNWTETDREVREAVRADLTPIFQIYGAPSWAQRCHRESSSNAPCNLDPEKFARFATAAASRYSGSFRGLPRVRYFQPQNEPNLFFYFNPQFLNDKPVSPGLYRAILNRFSGAVKAVHSSNLVITAGLAPIGRPHQTISPLRFARLLLCMRGRQHPRPTAKGCEGGVHFDILSVDPYTTGGPTHSAIAPDDVSLGDLPEVRRLLDAADRAGRIKGAFGHTPLWVTEFSWDSDPPDPGGLPTRIHARWTSEALYRAWKAGVSHFFWYSLRDGDRNGLPYDQTVQSGLYFRGATFAEDRPKRALRAFRFPFVAFRGARGIAVWGRTPTSKPGRVELHVQRGGGWKKLAVLRANASGIFRGLVRSSYGRGHEGLVLASYQGETSMPFSLHYVKDFYQPPFG